MTDDRHVDWMLAVGGPEHGRRIPAFPVGETPYIADKGRPTESRHIYRRQRIEGIQNVPEVLMHTKVTGKIARLQTYADAVSIERDRLLRLAHEVLDVQSKAAVPLLELRATVGPVTA